MRISLSGMVKHEEPQSKQTIRVGNIKTPGLSIFLIPGKWMLISVPTSICLAGPHDPHAMCCYVTGVSHSQVSGKALCHYRNFPSLDRAYTSAADRIFWDPGLAGIPRSLPNLLPKMRYCIRGISELSCRLTIRLRRLST